MASDDAPQCVLCAHFYVTWEPAFPRGCRAFAIKSHAYPSTAVQKESGMPCQAYQRKHVDPPSAPSRDRA